MASDDHVARRSQWLMQVAADRRLMPLAAPVAIVIAECVRRSTGVAEPGIGHLMAKTKGSERNVQKAIRSLEKHGHLSIETGTGRHRTNQYRWRIDAEKGVRSDTLSGDQNPVHSDTVSDGGKGVRSGRKRVSDRVKTPVRSDTRTYERTYEGTCEGERALTGPAPYHSSQEFVPYDHGADVEAGSRAPPPRVETVSDSGPGRPGRPERSDLFPDEETATEFQEVYRRREWDESFAKAAGLYLEARRELSQEVILESIDSNQFSDIRGFETFLTCVKWCASDDSDDQDFYTA